MHHRMVDALEPQRLDSIFLALRTVNDAFDLRYLDLAHRTVICVNGLLAIEQFIQRNSTLTGYFRGAAHFRKGIDGCFDNVVWVGRPL